MCRVSHSSKRTTAPRLWRRSDRFDLYDLAGKHDFYNAGNVPANLEPLYQWVNGCGNWPRNNPLFVKLRVLNMGREIEEAWIRNNWHDDWFVCEPIYLEWINNAEWIPIHTGPEKSPNCQTNGVPRFAQINDESFVNVHLRDEFGKQTYRELDMCLVGRDYLGPVRKRWLR